MRDRRQFYAAAALQGLIASHANPNSANLPNCESDFEMISEAAFGYADAMIKKEDEVENDK